MLHFVIERVSIIYAEKKDEKKERKKKEKRKEKRKKIAIQRRRQKVGPL